MIPLFGSQRAWEEKKKKIVFFQIVFPLDNGASYSSSDLCLISIWNAVGSFFLKTADLQILVDEK